MITGNLDLYLLASCFGCFAFKKKMIMKICIINFLQCCGFTVDPDDSLCPPPLSTTLAVPQRLTQAKAVLEKSQISRRLPCTKLGFDVKELYKILSQGCGVLLKGELQDPKIADWLLDPGAKEKTIHRMVNNFLPLETHLLEGKCSWHFDN